MSDTGTSHVDSNSCPTTLGYSIGLRNTPSITDQDIQGTYFITAMGDTGFPQAHPGRATYRVTSGTATFDGQGGGQLTLAESDEGDIKAQNEAFTYVIHNNVPLASDTGTHSVSTYAIVDLYKSPDDLNPIASAVVGSGGQNMIFYEDLATKAVQPGFGLVINGNPARLMGFAIHRNQ